MLPFLLSAVAISLSGVMAPGPITAATLAAGARSRHAGAMIGLGHAIVEIPLILLLVVGVGGFLESSWARAWIGLAGGVVLLLMGTQWLLTLRKNNTDAQVTTQRHPVVIGIVLTGANPYFLVWWATAGLALATTASEFGAMALLLFAIVHWLCDLGWLEVLFVVGHKGTEVFGRRAQLMIAVVCAVVLLGFGMKFLYDALSHFAATC
jgi:threonine/homoserine/homoserine lactone efflux protein